MGFVTMLNISAAADLACRPSKAIGIGACQDGLPLILDTN